MVYHVEVGGLVQFYAPVIPPRAMEIGVVRKDSGEAGALMRHVRK
jgi:hypothetical protein